MNVWGMDTFPPAMVEAAPYVVGCTMLAMGIAMIWGIWRLYR